MKKWSLASILTFIASICGLSNAFATDPWDPITAAVTPGDVVTTQVTILTSIIVIPLIFFVFKVFRRCLSGRNV